MKKKKTWFGWIVFAVITAALGFAGVAPQVSAPVAEVASQAAQESVEFDG